MALTDEVVVVLWLGNRGGRGEADLVGARQATALLGRVVYLL